MAQTAQPTTSWDAHRTLMLVSYGLVLAAFLPIGLSGEVGQAAPLAFLAAMVLSMFRDPRTTPPRPQTAKLWTAVVLASFVGLIAWAVQDGNWLLHALQFALLLTVSRFFQRRFAKDHLQLLALSFVLLLVAAIFQPGPLFAACFLAYTILTMWGLTLLHLARELEVQTHTGPEHLLPPPPPPRRWFGLLPPKAQPPPVAWPELPVHATSVAWRSQRLVGPRYLAATSLLSLAVLAGSSLFFLLFPRLGVGFFRAQTRPPKSVIGFSSEAQLGRFGALKDSAEVVMRVTFPGQPERLQRPLRLRGVTFERFEGNGWVRSEETPRPLRGHTGLVPLPQTQPPDAERERSYRAEIYLEPLDRKNPVLFTPPKTHAVELLDTQFDAIRGHTRRLWRNRAGDLTYQAPPETSLHYAVEVTEARRPRQEVTRLRNATGELPDEVVARYTQLPATLDPRMAPLAAQLAAGVEGWHARATAIETGLRAGWTYSLAGDQDAAHPLEDFLFGKKRGHCEYFATAMVLLLRTQGVPARTVHGFAGGLYNPIGNYRMVRQGDAHAWVEVYLPGAGWQTFDPTPPAGQVAEADESVTMRLRQLADSFNLLWYQWVVEYNLDRQIDLVKGVMQAMRNLRSPSTATVRPDAASMATDTAASRPLRMPTWLWLGLIGTAVVAAVVVWRRSVRQRQRQGFDSAIDRALSRLQEQLRRRGWERQPAETWHAVALRLPRQADSLRPDLLALATAYDCARYGPEGPAQQRDAVLAAAFACTTALRQLPRSRRTRHSDIAEPTPSGSLPPLRSSGNRRSS